MRFSDKTNYLAKSRSLSLLTRVEELKSSGRKIINFGSRPDAPSHAKNAVATFLASGISSNYTPTRGLPALREAIAKKLLNENHLTIDPDQEVVVAVGAKQGVYAALLALVDNGDEVLIEDPGWLGFSSIVNLAGATPIPVPVHENNNFHINVDDIRERITSRTRALLLCNPHNPTGAVLNGSELVAIGNLAHEHDFVIVADEAYDSLVYDNHTHVSLATLDGMWERTITVQTCSKVYNMGGWRIGWIIGSADAMSRIEAIQSSAISCPTSFAQAGVAAALSRSIGMGDEPIDQLLMRLARQRETLTNGLRKIPGVTCVQPSGGFFAFPNFSSFDLTSSALSEHLLDDAGIITVPGDAFGHNGEGHLRMLFTAPQTEIVTGLDILGNSLSKLLRTSVATN
jgi:aspartate/methionine/tyrosine aminotransferase